MKKVFLICGVIAVMLAIVYATLAVCLEEWNPTNWIEIYKAQYGEAEPDDPTEPDEPSEPNTPSDPTEPDKSTTPTEPSTPTDPTEPSTPTDPTKPTTPTEPTEPAEPEEPSETIIGAKEFIDKVNTLISPNFFYIKEDEETGQQVLGDELEFIEDEKLNSCKLTNEDMQTAEIQTTWGVYNDLVCAYKDDTLTYEKKFEYRQRMRAAGLYEAIPSPTLSANEQEYVNEVNKMIDAETIKQYMLLNAISAYQKLTSDEKNSNEMFTAYSAFELMRQVYSGTAEDEEANRTRAEIYMTEAGLR